MKNLSLFFLIFVPIFCFGQLNESFLDGNFINNPNWVGTTSNFYVNSSFQLQSKASTASTSFLFTPSEAIENATWECWVKVTYSTSSSNYAAVYLTSDRSDITSGCNGYYVQIGGTNDEVSLFVQEGTKKTKIIDGTDKRTDGNPVEIQIKVTRDADGNFTLYSKLPAETSYVQEGTTQNNVIKGSNFFGLMYVNTSTTGSSYYFDDIVVSGTKITDTEAPTWTSLSLEQPNKLKLVFSEAMDVSKAVFNVDQGMNAPTTITFSEDKKTVDLTFGLNFEKGKIYKLQLSGLTDLAGNTLIETFRTIGIVEPKAVGDLILNEVMFENPLNSLEYVELYNKSDKLLDVSNLVVTTRKTDGTLNTGSKVPQKTLLLPHTYLALCADADSVRNYHYCPTEANILTATGSWSALNNESSTLVLASAAKDTIYDEVAYNVKWHNSWVTNPKGISLERSGPDLPTQNQFSWHSCVSTSTNNGTPGFTNSVYVDAEAPTWFSLNLEQPNKLKLVFSEAMDISKATFTVDNNLGAPLSIILSDDKKSIDLSFASNFEKGRIYKIQLSGLTDLAGNALAETSRSIGIVEQKAVGDLILNEVMFENPLNSLEYVELYNKSEKLLDISGLVLTTRKTDGTLNTGSKVPQKTLLLPHTYLALCADADSVRNYHHCPTKVNILAVTGSWSALNNESSTLVLVNAAKDTIYDELTYNTKWHNSWVTNPKGISLERSAPDLPTQNQFSWHSCVSTATNNGTPGFTNSVYVDTGAPTWISLNLEQPNKLKLVFSEAMDVRKAVFTVDNNFGTPSSITVSDDKKTIDLTFTSNFEKGKIYKLQLSGLTDLAGNALAETFRTIGIAEQKAVGDLILNEVMFENPLNSLEYVELYNKSDKLLDVSNILITTRKTDGSLNTGSKVPQKTWLLPHAYLALCANADSVRNYHHCPAEANVFTGTGSWYSLNNESSTLVLVNVAKDTIYDELTYNAKWHNSWVTNPKGISLERSAPDLPTQNQFFWHSCVSTANNNGTPGFTNSVYVDTEAPVWTSFTLEQPNKLKLVFSEAMDVSKAVFTVDNNLGIPSSKTLSDDKKTVDLTFTSNFDKGKIYKLQLSGLTDLAGNALAETSRSIGIVEQKSVGDLILNEVMFENPLNSLEYVELYNKSDKLLDVSNILITTRKTDGSLNTGSKVPQKTWLLPHAYLALCANADSVKNYHHCPTKANILTVTGSWYPLNNESSTLVLASAAKDTIYDEVNYNVRWHNTWVTNPKGISLERSGPDLPTQNQFSWHSCVSTSTNNGTPGFANSVYVDTETPTWTSLSIEQPKMLKLIFSEGMDVSKAVFSVDHEINAPSSVTLSDDKKTIDLTFTSTFEKGKIYKLQLSGLTDLAGNALAETTRSIGIVEPKAIGDLILNEVMFENPLNSLEYVELYNKSDKLLDVSNIVVTTRKTDGTLNTGSKVPPKTWLLPHAYLALCANADSVRNYHKCPIEINILTVTGSWYPLNNESSTLVLASAAKDTIYDELNYNVRWHNTWVTNPKGISLERSGPDLPTQNQFSWHSCVSASTNNGTPGFANSVYVDTEAPVWISLNLEQPNKIKLVFSEAMDVSKATFIVDQGINTPTTISISDYKKSIYLTFASNFEKGKIYKLQLSGLTDLAGNALVETTRSIGIEEPKAVGDLILNEVMFENPLNSLEYVELYNKSDKLLDISNLVVTTRKTDGTLNTGSKVPQKTLMLPHAYLALCANADSVRNYHHCPAEANILTVTGSWYPLNNESSTLVLASAAKDTIYDEVNYNVKWHNAFVKHPKGVALERINPSLPTQNAASWHSAASEVNYGTPGYQNSQYRDISVSEVDQKIFRTDPEAFSPDNDGVNDVCFIRYKTDTTGYVANVLILNQVGMKVYQLASSILLSSEGFLTWDGRTDKGKIANSGIYVLYVEMFNPQTGAKKIIKLPIVVSTR